eukprot:1218496-Rhodomonas_salina.1
MGGATRSICEEEGVRGEEEEDERRQAAGGACGLGKRSRSGLDRRRMKGGKRWGRRRRGGTDTESGRGVGSGAHTEAGTCAAKANTRKDTVWGQTLRSRCRVSASVSRDCHGSASASLSRRKLR